MLDTDGSISRGISVGNNQHAGINSNFNLNINGELTNNLKIKATISDNNIPLQPDGYTQQIQDFDRIYINLFNDQFFSTIGDYDLISNKSYYTRFHKKLLGAELKSNSVRNEKDAITSHAAAAISKGKLHRMSIQGKEGVQGPYMLRGANNEQYIIVLAGSERVYLDGHLLTRGASNDYTIDYNTGEIYFTTQQLITKDKRIIIEFEYSDKNYTRYLLFNHTEMQRDNKKIYFSVYSETDAKNQPLLEELTAQQKKIMQESGDSLTDAFVPHIDTLLFSESRIMYKAIDTLHEGTSYSILVHATHPDLARYTAGFTHVGPGKGNYKLLSSTSNGRIYAWIAPKEGEPQGEYEPIRQLIPPNSHQVYSMGGALKLGQNTLLSLDGALSRIDLNTFSNLHHQDNLGLGINARLQNRFALRKQSTFHYSLQYRHQSATFKPIERIKSAEFERDWNLLPSLHEQADEHHVEAIIVLETKKDDKFEYQANLLSYPSHFHGFQNSLQANYSLKYFTLKTNSSLNTGNFKQHHSQFMRSYNDLSYRIKKHTTGLTFDYENNKLIQDDSLMTGSFSFHDYNAYLTNKATEPLHYRISYGRRSDYLPDSNAHLSTHSEAENLSLKLSTEAIRKHHIRAVFSYRTLRMQEGFTDQARLPERTLLTRIGHQYQSSESLFSLETEYEAGSGLERKHHHTYVQVPDGQGTHEWIDYNENGIQENGEFEVASFQDKAQFIRIITQTEDYIPVHQNKITQTVQLDPYTLFKKSTGWHRHLQHVENKLHYVIHNKIQTQDVSQQINPFVRNMADSSLISNQIQIRNTTYFNKRNRRWGAYYRYVENHRKEILTSGFTENKQYRHIANARIALLPQLRIEGSSSFENTTQEQENYMLNNYHLKRESYAIEGEYTPRENIRIGLSYLYGESRNKSGQEKGYEHNLGGDISGSTKKGTQIQIETNWIELRYNSQTNSTIAHQVLKGLLPGRNLTWGIFFYRILNQGIEINISYEGRQSITSDSKAIHTGNITVRANF